MGFWQFTSGGWRLSIGLAQLRGDSPVASKMGADVVAISTQFLLVRIGSQPLQVVDNSRP
jgi:hypothetical protein